MLLTAEHGQESNPQIKLCETTTKKGRIATVNNVGPVPAIPVYLSLYLHCPNITVFLCFFLHPLSPPKSSGDLQRQWHDATGTPEMDLNFIWTSQLKPEQERTKRTPFQSSSKFVWSHCILSRHSKQWLLNGIAPSVTHRHKYLCAFSSVIKWSAFEVCFSKVTERCCVLRKKPENCFFPKASFFTGLININCSPIILSQLLYFNTYAKETREANREKNQNTPKHCHIFSILYLNQCSTYSILAWPTYSLISLASALAFVWCFATLCGTNFVCSSLFITSTSRQASADSKDIEEDTDARDHQTWNRSEQIQSLQTA